jgi:hypothetical protein
MSAHLSTPEQTYLISRKLEQGLPTRQLTELFAHLAKCTACRDAVNELRNNVMQLSDTIEWTPAHLEFEQLAGYVVNNLNEIEREIADNHLSICDFCAHEVQVLTQLQRELPVIAAPVYPQPKTVWWMFSKQNWSAVLFKSVWTPVWALSIVVLLTALGGWWWQRRTMETTTALQPIVIPSPVSGAATPHNIKSEQTTTKLTESLLALNDNGQTVVLGKDGRITTSLALPPAYQVILATTLAQQRLSLPPVLKTLSQPSRQLKGGESGASSFSVLAPVGAVLQTARPVFRWEAVAGASGYTVAIFDQNFNRIQESGTLVLTQWRAAQPLPRGRVLLWQVTARIDDKHISAPSAPAPEARFQILAAKPAAELQRARREYPKSHLLLGTLCAQAGLIEEAMREFQALQAENPQSPIVKKLLHQLRQMD